VSTRALRMFLSFKRIFIARLIIAHRPADNGSRGSDVANVGKAAPTCKRLCRIRQRAHARQPKRRSSKQRTRTTQLGGEPH
jgi:hypothetical protein